MRLASGEVLQADVVIDCSGRYSQTPRWLEQAGWSASPEQRVESHIVYASRHYQRPEDFKEVGHTSRNSLA